MVIELANKILIEERDCDRKYPPTGITPPTFILPELACTRFKNGGIREITNYVTSHNNLLAIAIIFSYTLRFTFTCIIVCSSQNIPDSSSL